MTGPGPNKYVLPTLTGFDNHDLRKIRSPAYSVGFRNRPDDIIKGVPGPKYNPGQFIRTGKFSSPQSVILPRRGHELKFNGIPGPTKYKPGPDPSYPNSPSAVILYRKTLPTHAGINPGPKYLVKGAIGRPIEDLPSAPAWSILQRNIQNTDTRRSPGPRYGAVNLKLIKRRYPEATVTGRLEPPTKGIIPGPKYLGPYSALRRQPPSWSFGVKHTEKQAMLCTTEDQQPFYGF